jgi:ABC-type transport system involved in multi-copper enzyme maturation permease subunit
MAINSKSFPAYFALFKVTFRQMFWSRRTVLILLGCLLPIVIALVFRFVARSGGMVNRFVPQMTLILYGLLVNLCAIFYGTAIISDEIDSKGLMYLQMRPLRKSAILLSKFAAYILGTVALIATSHLILTGIMATHPKLEKSVFFQFGMSLRYTATMALALLAYGALAAALAARFKNPVLWGLLFVTGWENITASPVIATGIKRLSVSHYLFAIFPRYKLPRSDFNEVLGSSPPSVWVALLVLCLLTVVLLYLAIRIFREREYLM